MKKLVILLLMCVTILSGCTTTITAYEYTKTETNDEQLKKITLYSDQKNYSYKIPTEGITYKLYFNCYDAQAKVSYQIYDEYDNLYSEGSLTCNEPVTTKVTPSAGTMIFTVDNYSQSYVNGKKSDTFGDTELEDLADEVALGYVNIERTREQEVYYKDIDNGDGTCTRQQGVTIEERDASTPENIECSEMNTDGEMTTYEGE